MIVTDDLALAAVDLGASSGRVMVGRVGANRLDLTEVHRFWNGPVRLGHTLHWDVLGLYRETCWWAWRQAGRRSMAIGIDSWAVDYGLLGSRRACSSATRCTTATTAPTA